MTNSSNDGKPRNPPPQARPAPRQPQSLASGFLNQVASSTTRAIAMTLVGAVTSLIFEQDLDGNETAQTDLPDDSEESYLG